MIELKAFANCFPCEVKCKCLYDIYLLVSLIENKYEVNNTRVVVIHS